MVEMKPVTGHAAQAGQGAPPRREGSPRWLTRSLIALATLFTVIAVFAVWANRQLLNTDAWTQTSEQLIESPPVREAVSGYLTDQLYANVDVTGELRSGLPTQLKPLAGPAAGALRNLVEKGVNLALERPIVQELWGTANEVAHAQFVKLIENKGTVVKLPGGGRVVLDLRPLLTEAAKRVGAPTSAVSKIPADVAEVQIVKSSELQAMQTAVNLLRKLAIVLPLLALALYALAVFLARGHRAQTLVAVGGTLLIAGLIVLIARSLAGKAVVDSLTKTESVRPAADAIWSIGTSMLSQTAAATMLLGLPVIFAGVLGGPSRAAVSTRRAIAPELRDRPGVAFGVVGLLLLLLLIWSPIAATRSWLGILLIIVLSLFGMQMLRRQTATEFPDARADDGLRLRSRATAAAGAVAKAGSDLRAEMHEARARRRGGEQAPGATAGAGTREGAGAGLSAAAEAHRAPAPGASAGAGDLAGQLERLAQLHSAGALTDEEYATAKRQLLRSAG